MMDTYLQGEIEACTACELCKSRTNVVVYRGHPKPVVLFVGEAPGAEEDEQGKPFVGDAGKKLDEKLEWLSKEVWGEIAGKLAWSVVYKGYGILNVIKCRPPDNKFKWRYASMCRHFLQRQIEHYDPLLIVTLGGTALKELTGLTGVTKHNGTVQESKTEYGSRKVIPLFHPSSLNYNRPKTEPEWEKGWLMLWHYLKHPAEEPGPYNELASKVLEAIEDKDPSVTERGFTHMSTTRRWRVEKDIEEILESELGVSD